MGGPVSETEKQAAGQETDSLLGGGGGRGRRGGKRGSRRGRHGDGGEGKRRDRLDSLSLSVGGMAQVPRTMGSLQLAAWVFLAVNGGAYGIESAVMRTSPLVFLLLMVAIPLLWSVPIALISSELASAFPESSGGVVDWASRAWGQGAGRLVGYAYLLANFFDNCMYPMLVTNYIQSWALGSSSGATDTHFSDPARLGVSLTVCLLAVGLNCMGLEVAGFAVVAFSTVILAPLLLMSGMALPYVSPASWGNDQASTDWSVMLGIVLWCNSGWEDLGNLANSVKNPQRTFPRALFAAAMLVSSATALPVMLSLSVQPDVSQWTGTFFNTVALEVGGKWLQAFMSVGACVGLFSNLLAQLLVNACATHYCAARGWLPALLARQRASDGQPYAATLFCGAVVMALQFVSGSFAVMSQVWLVLYSSMVLVLLLLFITLRIRFPPSAEAPKGKPAPHATHHATRHAMHRPYIAFGSSLAHALVPPVAPLAVLAATLYFFALSL